MTARHRDRLDAELRVALEAAASGALGKLLSEKTIVGRRKAMDELSDLLLDNKRPDDGVKQQDHIIPGLEAGPDVRVRVYHPADVPGPLPALCWMHGGGRIMGRLELSELTATSYVRRLGCAVVSVDYRLAPENPHPAALDDCYAALQWTADHAAELQIDAGRIAIGGESAGGGLAASTALLARDRGGPALIFQLLVCPMLDDRNVTPSSHEITDIGVWDRWHNVEAWTAVLGQQAGCEGVSPYAAAARAEDLSGLPPAYIDVGELDVVRDEDIDYATRLMQAGVAAELHVFPGAFHGFDLFAPRASVSKQAATARRDALHRAFHAHPNT